MTPPESLIVFATNSIGESWAEVGQVSRPGWVSFSVPFPFGLDRLSTLPLSLRLIREIHAHLLKGVRGERKMPGQFRTSQNWVGGPSIAEASYVPPPPDDMLRALHDLEAFLHKPEELPVLLHCALVHAQFETIHPFLDGNGRIGRLLIPFQLCHTGVLARPLLYLSYYFKVYRQEYYDRLQAIRTHGAWEEWIRFFLRGIAAVSESATNTAREFHALRERLRASLDVSRTGRELVHALFRHPIVTANRAAELLDCTFAAANKNIQALEAAGVLVEITGQKRNRRYRFQPYLDLFSNQALRNPGPGR